MSDKKSNIAPHPTSYLASEDRVRDRENLARQMRTSQMMRELAREQINPTQLITDLNDIDLALQGEEDSAGNTIPIEREIISALKARADIKFRLLDKVLPSIKATESVSHNIHDHNVTQRVSDVELATRLQLWREKQGATIEGKLAETKSDVDATLDEEKEYEFL